MKGQKHCVGRNYHSRTQIFGIWLCADVGLSSRSIAGKETAISTRMGNIGASLKSTHAAYKVVPFLLPGVCVRMEIGV